ncbi:MAG: M14 family metallopeptidase [Alphaproteobacteria bacterium]|nr:M14 family metallopeptidase [Alphaproteobacteria bacterium]MCW5740612.1 M14 family metallopeptidase [Alphaproteobacteria bacterium]
MSHHDHFSPDYRSARAKFRAACAEQNVEVTSWPHPLKGFDGEELATDAAWVGPRDSSRILVLCSGTHGVEGLYGSGVQTGFLRDGLHRELPPGVAALLVHATNPWGFSWLRRVNEDNIDINRNFRDFHAKLPPNKGYLDIAAYLEPREWNDKVRGDLNKRLRDFAAANGMAALNAAIAAGQHTHPNGVFYGGTGPSWSNRTIFEIVPHFLAEADAVCVLDLHTGLGPFGYSELICRHAPGSAALRLARQWFGEAVTSPQSGESQSPVIEGNLRMAFPQILPEATVVASAIEVGTLSATEVNAALFADNWLHLHGDPRSKQGEEIRRQVRDAFYPDSADWRDLCYPRAVEIQRAALAGLAGL